MTNWETGKCATLMELQTDAAKKSVWRSSTIITPRSSSANSHHNKGKAPMMLLTSKRHHPIVFKQQTPGSHDSFGTSGSKVTPNTLRSWGHLKDAKAYFNGSSKPTTFGKHLKPERNNSRNYESGNNAKKRLTTGEINIRRNTSACMNCGKVGHVFNDCPKPKP